MQMSLCDGLRTMATRCSYHTAYSPVLTEIIIEYLISSNDKHPFVFRANGDCAHHQH